MCPCFLGVGCACLVGSKYRAHFKEHYLVPEVMFGENHFILRQGTVSSCFVLVMPLAFLFFPPTVHRVVALISRLYMTRLKGSLRSGEKKLILV